MLRPVGLRPGSGAGYDVIAAQLVVSVGRWRAGLHGGIGRSGQRRQRGVPTDPTRLQLDAERVPGRRVQGYGYQNETETELGRFAAALT